MTSSSLAEAMADLNDFREGPGVSCAALREGELRTACWGYADVGRRMLISERTRFAAGCIAKLYTAALVRALANVGPVVLDDPLVGYEGTVNRSLSAMDLMRHRGGLLDVYPMASVDPFSAKAEDRLSYADHALITPLLAAPGAEHSYSSSGYVVLGTVVEKLTTMSWVDAVNALVLEPHGLPALRETVCADTALGYSGRAGLDTPWHPRLRPLFSASGGTLVTTPGELVRFALAAISPIKDVIGIEIDHGYMVGAQIVFGWYVFSTPAGRLFFHPGSHGYHDSIVVCLPESDFAFALSTNSGALGMGKHRILRKILARLFKIDWFPELPEAPIGARAPAKVAGYVGVYRNGPSSLRVGSPNDGALVIWYKQSPGALEEPLRIQPRKGMYWEGPRRFNRRMIVRFFAEADGTISKVAAHGWIFSRLGRT